MLCLVFSLWTGAAHAQEPAVELCVDQLADADVTALLAFTTDSLKAQRRGAGLWFGGWSTFNVVNVSIGTWQIATTDARIDRDKWIMSTIGAAGFLVNAAIQPLPGLYAYKRIRHLPERTPAERRAKLKSGVALLERAALRETTNSNLLAHMGGLFFAVVSAGYIWLHNLEGDPKRVWTVAGIQAGATIVGAEATLWSTPRRARRDIASVRSRACQPTQTALRQAAPRADGLSVSVSATSIGLRLRF